MMNGRGSYVFCDWFQTTFYAFWRAFYINPHVNMLVGAIMDDEVRYYKGKHKVKVLTESRENWIVEALESFEDVVDGETVEVKKGERRIVAPNLLFQREALPPPVKEHAYELKMEKKLKRLVQEEEKEDEDKTT
jgi:hypothetical protein